MGEKEDLAENAIQTSTSQPSVPTSFSGLDRSERTSKEDGSDRARPLDRLSDCETAADYVQLMAFSRTKQMRSTYSHSYTVLRP